MNVNFFFMLMYMFIIGCFFVLFVLSTASNALLKNAFTFVSFVVSGILLI